jgi:hypothetical protein
MSWRSAFLLQARSDNAVRRQLNLLGVEYCHQLHYVQMTAEKLCKAIMSRDSDPNPPEFTHAAIVSGLKTLKTRPDVRRMLGYKRFDQFRFAIDSLLPLASRIERLAPALAGSSGPNPEYPWRANAALPVTAPVEFDFADLNIRSPQMSKFLAVIDRLLAVLA